VVILSKIKTYLYLKAVAFSNQEEAEELKRLLRSNLKTHDKIERVKALLIVLGLQKQRKMRFRFYV
jgi:geranylgeranyl diphosphate synthase type II